MNLNNRTPFLGLLSVLLAISHTGCGGRPTPVISVAATSVDNLSPIIQVGETGQFYALVTGAPQNGGVNRSLTCPVNSCGSISPTSSASEVGITYTPPPSVPNSNLTVTLTAASITEASARGSVAITVPSVGVTVAPAGATVPSGGTAQFTATLKGDSTNAGVTWMLLLCHGGSSFGHVCQHPPACKCGTLLSSSSASDVPITYTAPASPPLGGELTLTATSVANPFAVTVSPITVSPSSNSSAVDANDSAPSEPAGKLVHYKVINLGTLGGTASNGFGGVNDRGWVTGDANLAGDQNEHAFLWRDGVMTDLGTLGGPNSSVPLPVKDDRGFVVGVAQTPVVDPLSEFWGRTFACTSVICEGAQNLVRGFVWEDGVMTALPTLGGNNNGALGANHRGQIVGAAETANQDPNCVSPQVLDFRAVVWGPNPGQVEALAVFPGDSVAAALAINDTGQVVGTSGPCQGPSSGLALRHALLWERDTVTLLGGLGGAMSNAANGINNRGQVVGQSDLPGDTVTHAFLWQKGVMTDLGTLPGDSNSMAFDINEKGQVVGVSCAENFNCRAFLWEDGVMTDLNTLIPPNSPLFLTFGAGINDRGEITGTACVLSDGVCSSAVPAFLAVPCNDEHGGHEPCAGGVTGEAPAAPAIGQRSRITLPEHIRKGRSFGSFAARLIEQQ